MGVDVEYKLNGRRVTRDQFFGGLEGQLRRAAIDQMRARVERVRCPQHGQAARLSSTRETRGSLEFTLSGCCNALVARARRAAS
jgi:hypothetical protein